MCNLRKKLIHRPFVKRVYTKCSPLIQLIALIIKAKVDKKDTILVMIQSKVIHLIDFPSLSPG